MDDERWSSDLNLLCERLSERLAEDGAVHADAAALCIAVRGLRSTSARDFAREVHLTPAELARVETGEVAWADLPAAHQAMWDNRHQGATYLVNHALPSPGLRSRDALFEAWAAGERA